MNLPNFTAEASLGRHSRNISRAHVGAGNGQRRNLQSSVIPALPPQNGNGGPPEVTCTACSASGWKTCTDHETGKKTQTKCTSCGPCAVSQAVGPTLGTFQQTCTTGGQPTTKPCTFCKDFPISTPWPLPDICLRLCISSLLNPNTWTLTQC
jgi:hypothetical protein